MANCYRIFTPPSSRAQRGNPLQSHDPSFLASVAWRSITQVLWTTPQGLDCHVGMKPPRSDGKKSSVIRSARWQTTTEPPLLRHRARSAAIHLPTLRFNVIASVAIHCSDCNKSTPFAFNLMPIKQPCVYILASKKNGTLYVGVTSNLPARVWQHKNDVVEGFSQRYGIHNLVWYEVHPNMQSAILREKQLKKGSRQRKIDLIIEMNPQWRDLYPEIVS